MLLESLTSPGRIGMTRQTAMMQGKSLEAYLDDWRNMSDAEFNRISSQAMKLPAARGEFMAYPHLMVLVPPADCDEPTVLEEKIFKPIRSCDSQEVPSKILRAAHDKFIAKRWKINYTRLAKDWYVHDHLSVLVLLHNIPSLPGLMIATEQNKIPLTFAWIFYHEMKRSDIRL